VPGFVSRVEELEVFQRAYRLSLEVHRASLEFPRINPRNGPQGPAVRGLR
jgi:hypothetical protein